MGLAGSAAPQTASADKLLLSYILQVYVVEQEPHSTTHGSTPPTSTMR